MAKTQIISRIDLPLKRICTAVPIILILLIACAVLVSSAQDYDYEGAITAKMTEIRWAQADLLAAQRELAILNQFLSNYETKAGDIADICQQLTNADSTLASIQQDNLVKLTIFMGIETYSAVSDTINAGKRAANALVTLGLKSAVGDAAQDQLTGSLEDGDRAALGIGRGNTQ
ncbi:MAG: hypothetical protein JW901_11055 [Dehalococcoidia bacterium]|nr:hypothetical protein [Dehalococcoidia bacterium]